MDQDKIDPIGYTLLGILFLLLVYAGWLSYKSIDWDVLKRMESQTLILPTQMPVQPLVSSPSATPKP